MKRIVSIVMAVLLLGACLSGCGGGGAKKVVIASKLYTENILLSEMVAQLIEDRTDITVERKQALGGTSVCYPAMENGEVDLYVEYSGTIFNEILKRDVDPTLTSDDIYDIVRTELKDNLGITFYDAIGINNTYALGLLKELAAELGVTSMTDLAPHAPELVFGANHLYYTRLYDGYDAMVEKYNLHFKEVLKMDSSLLYDAVAQGQVDVMVVYATDSLLKKYEMTILADDLQMYPAYYGAPMIRTDTLEKYPELNDVLNLLAGRIGDERMQELNYLVDVENKQVDEVAKAFLQEEGLLS